MTEATMHEEFRTIPLADLIPSTTNPRRRRDAKADAELADSIRKVGLIEPLGLGTSWSRLSICLRAEAYQRLLVRSNLSGQKVDRHAVKAALEGR